MDRFIDSIWIEIYRLAVRLKSNMDRFIAYQLNAIVNMWTSLKSNMDRFIAKPDPKGHSDY